MILNVRQVFNWVAGTSSEETEMVYSIGEGKGKSSGSVMLFPKAW